MNTQKVASALNTISLAFGELAEALIEQPVAGGAPTTSPPSADLPPPEEREYADQPSLADESVDFAPQGSLAQCPAHHEPYMTKNGRQFCPKKGSDPAWTNNRGYCTVTPKNAAEYLRTRAAA